MAILHKGSTIRPTKPEVLETRLGRPVEVLASYRFDDPEGEVGVEAFVVRCGGATHHVVLTYRGAALPGAEEHLVATMQHTALGPRWVYDGAGDPVAIDCFRRAVLGELEQAKLELWDENHQLVGVREPTVRLTATPGGAGPDAELTIVTELDAELATPESRLEAVWDGGAGVVAYLR